MPFWVILPPLYSPLFSSLPFILFFFLLLYEYILLIVICVLSARGCALQEKVSSGGKKKLTCRHHHCKTCFRPELTDFLSLFFLELGDFSVSGFSLTGIDVHLPSGPLGPGALTFATLPWVWWPYIYRPVPNWPSCCREPRLIHTFSSSFPSNPTQTSGCN